MIRRDFVTALTAQAVPATKRIDKGPPIAMDVVKEFVGAGHGNLDKVKEMLAAQPSLVRVAYDWGGGDFESALGGAGHMGQREIAEYLLAHGAQLELPAACMLGWLELVKTAIAAFPEAAKTLGPHGITLIAHARKGGAQSEPVLRYLESLS